MGEMCGSQEGTKWEVPNGTEAGAFSQGEGHRGNHLKEWGCLSVCLSLVGKREGEEFENGLSHPTPTLPRALEQPFRSSCREKLDK